MTYFLLFSFQFLDSFFDPRSPNFIRKLSCYILAFSAGCYAIMEVETRLHRAKRVAEREEKERKKQDD
jgi:hypothetical protein